MENNDGDRGFHHQDSRANRTKSLGALSCNTP